MPKEANQVVEAQKSWLVHTLLSAFFFFVFALQKSNHLYVNMFHVILTQKQNKTCWKKSSVVGAALYFWSVSKSSLAKRLTKTSPTFPTPLFCLTKIHLYLGRPSFFLFGSCIQIHLLLTPLMSVHLSFVFFACIYI